MGINVHPKVAEAYRRYADQVLEKGVYSLGELTEFAEVEWGRIDRRCVATSSGTTALELVGQVISRRIDGCQKPFVLVPAMTMPAVAWAFERAGFNIVLIDSDPLTGCVRLQDVMSRVESWEALKLQKAIAAVVVVHNGGVVAREIEAIAEYCKKQEIALVEDCSHAHGCFLGCKEAGTFGDYEAWSFYPTKVLISSEGGMARFAREEDAKLAQRFANQGKERGSGVFGPSGYNLRPSELSMALMLAEIEIKEEAYREREMWAKAYRDFAEVKLVQDRGFENQSTYYKYTILLEPAQVFEVSRKLKEAGFPPTGATFDTTLCDRYGVPESDFPGARSWVQRHLNLPYKRFAGKDVVYETALAVQNALR